MTVLTLSAPLGGTYASGTTVSAWSGFIASISVFDKAGTLLGLINDYSIAESPSRVISGRGGMTFYVPRNSPDVNLIRDDRLVAIQTELDDELWAGTMTVTESGGGMLQVSCDDAFQLLSDGVPLELEEEVPDNTPATSFFSTIIDRMNAERALTGEIQWAKDITGTKIFRGDLSVSGSPYQCVEAIARRSQTEFAWRAELNPNLVLTFVARDEFSIAASTTFADGPGGNIVAEPRIIRDASPVVNYIRLRGQSTDIKRYLPDWAHWAVHEVTPEVEASVDPGEYRRRADLEVTVDWSLSKTQQRALAQRTLEVIWEMYSSFLRAVHDWMGRPFHEGWKYEGVPDSFGARGGGVDGMSRRTWTTRLQLLEIFPDEPVSGVMISDGHSLQNFRMWMIVEYDRLLGEQTVGVYPLPQTAGVSLVQWIFAATAGTQQTIYRVSAGRVVGTRVIDAPNTAYVAPYNVKIWYPAGNRYLNLRQFISTELSNGYWLDPSLSFNQFIDLGPEASLDYPDEGGSAFIGKMYDFEAYRVKDWDPRRDGVGELVAKKSAWAGGVTTRARWKIVSFDTGESASTQTIAGLSASDTQMEVQSVLGFPPDPGFQITVDDGPAAEDMLVTAMAGGEWTVIRGWNGTTATLHEPGVQVRRLGGGSWDGFAFPYEWPDGQEYANALVQKLSQPSITININVANVDDLWSSIQLGSVHPINLSTEGASAGWVGDTRVRGYAVDAAAGKVELILDWLG